MPFSHGASQPSKRSWSCSLFTRLYHFFKKEEEKPSFSIEEQEADDAFMQRTLHFKALKAKDIGIPQTDIVAVPVTIPFQELIKTFISCTFSRLPVYEGTLDNVLGMVHIKDIIKYALHAEDFSMQKEMRKVLFISPSLSLKDLLLEMQASHIHLALIVDEYGGVDRLITIEDVIEQIVGEIQDEHDDQKEPKILAFGENTYLADARMSLVEFTKAVPIELPLSDKEEDVDTLGGYVIGLLGHVPIRGELVKLSNGVEFEVLEADPRRLKRLRVRVPQQSA